MSQVGRRFWEMALEEHSQNNPEGIFDEAMTSFFRNVDAR
jgi:tubulin epsilon